MNLSRPLLARFIHATKVRAPIGYGCIVLTRKMSNVDVNKVDLRGIFPPITTPFFADESLAWDKLDENLIEWNNIPFKGYVVLGSNAEAAYLNEREKVALVRHVASRAPVDHVIMAGVGCESTRETQSLIDEVAEIGAHCALVLTPSYYRSSMTAAAYYQHYTKLADASPIPIVLYSVPGNTAIDLDLNVIIDLAQHPNIIGLKDSGGDITKLTRIVQETKKHNFQVLAGSAGFLYPGLSVGCVGGVCALANVLGNEVCQVYSLYMSKKYEEALTLQQRLIAPNSAVTKLHGVPGLKYAMDKFGFYGGPTRSPLQPISENVKHQLDAIFKDFTTEDTKRSASQT